MGLGFEDDVTQPTGFGPPRRLRSALLVPFAIVACSTDEPLDQKVDDPIAALSATPSRGVAPFEVVFDASQSRDPAFPTASLVGRFDFDGDGNYDADAVELKSTHRYETAGTYVAKVLVTSTEGRTAFATTSIEVIANTAPTALLSYSPGDGNAPLGVNFDASGSNDPDQDAATLEVRFDFEGDGTFDTEYAAAKLGSHTFNTAGEYFPTVEVRDRAGAIGTFRAQAPLVIRFGANLAADTNRDGKIDDADELDEDSWTEAHGALFLANLDDDDNNGRQDARDTAVNGNEDVRDLVPVIIRRHGGVVDGRDTATLSLEPAGAKNNVRVFLQSGGRLASLISPEGNAQVTIAPNDLLAGDLQLYVEGLNTRTAVWDGRANLRLAITVDGQLQEDVVSLRVAPVIFTDNLQEARALFVMRISDRRLGENLAFADVLRSDLPNGVELIEADQYVFGGDRWIQDNMQAGYQLIVGPGGTVLEMPTFAQLQRPTGQGGLEAYVPEAFLAPDRGYFYPGRSRDTSLNYGGNLEVMAPFENSEVSYPLGRLVIGGGNLGTLGGVAFEDHMGEVQRNWLNAQGVQGPAVEISSEWLAVGHIDETFQIVPYPQAATGAKPYKVVYASPNLARQLLLEVQSAGGGNRAVFAGRQTQTTVDAILEDPALMALNDAAQARLDTNKAILKAELDLKDEDFVEVPVMFEGFDFDGLDLVAALNPGIQNLVTTNNTLFVPDPEGPIGADGKDVWRKSADATLSGLGVEPIFVDVFDSYHLNLGEAHCGTNVLAVPYSTPWWTAAVGPRNR
jgi:protein-arginine deiminase